MLTPLSLHGRTFGMLQVLRRAPKRGHWVCLCACGKYSRPQQSNLLAGRTKSCGCVQKAHATTHGQASAGVATPEYRSWQMMKSRCLNPNNKKYRLYGGRGIKICARWLASFTNFYADMGPRPAGTSLERKDGNKGYNPRNCEWATIDVQNRNRNNNVFLTARGRTLCLEDWRPHIPVSHQAVRERLRKGWAVEEALFTPRNKQPGAQKAA